ncbi:dephospho-CoA kinase [Klebsiella michiganensis]
MTYTVALTGGIGSGKSTVADAFSHLGVNVIDADIIARQVVEPGTPGLNAIAQRFGPQILNKDGTLNRRALREHIFAHAEDKNWLNALLHPQIQQETRRQMQLATSSYILWVVPLLVENRLSAKADRRLAVADDVIENMGSPDAIASAVARLHAKYQQLAAQAASQEKP